MLKFNPDQMTHFAAETSAHFRKLIVGPDHPKMTTLLEKASGLGVAVDVHMFTPGNLETIREIIKPGVEKAFGTPGLLVSDELKSLRFAITLSNDSRVVVGTIVGDWYPYSFKLKMHCVAEAERRKGLGRLLYEAADVVVACVAKVMHTRELSPCSAVDKTVLVMVCVDSHADWFVTELVEGAGFEDKYEDDGADLCQDEFIFSKHVSFDF